jgi:hypothetical protein
METYPALLGLLGVAAAVFIGIFALIQIPQGMKDIHKTTKNIHRTTEASLRGAATDSSSPLMAWD